MIKLFLVILCLGLIFINSCRNNLNIPLPEFHDIGGHRDWRCKFKVIKMYKDGTISIDGQEKQLSDLNLSPSTTGEFVVIIKADKNIFSTDLSTLLNRLNTLGFEVVYFAVANDEGYKNALRVILEKEKTKNHLLIHLKANRKAAVTLKENNKVISHGVLKITSLKNRLPNAFSQFPDMQAIIFPAKNSTYQEMIEILNECWDAGCYNLHIGE